MKSTILTCALLLTGIIVYGSAQAQNQGGSFSGRVDRVWEDGFQLNTGNRTLIVDTYDICGDNTARHVKVGQQLKITGEFEGGEFDVFSMTKASGEKVCS